MNEKEKSWIENYNAVNSDDYYNMIEGGNTGSHLISKNSKPIVCIDNNFVFKSISDASLWSGYSTSYIKKTYKKKHYLDNPDEKLIFRSLTYVKEKCSLCIVCGCNFKKRSNAHKKCNKCSKLKGRLIINFDFYEIDSNIIGVYKLSDGWVKRKIEQNDKICKDCGLQYEKTRPYQRRCDDCQNKRDKKSVNKK